MEEYVHVVNPVYAEIFRSLPSGMEGKSMDLRLESASALKKRVQRPPWLVLGQAGRGYPYGGMRGLLQSYSRNT